MTLGDHETPRHVTQVTGCDCGGLLWHSTRCSLWSVPPGTALRAIESAGERIRAYTAGLNAALRCGGLGGPDAD